MSDTEASRKVRKIDERALRERALDFASRLQEPKEASVARARRYLEFLKGRPS